MTGEPADDEQADCPYCGQRFFAPPGHDPLKKHFDWCVAYPTDRPSSDHSPTDMAADPPPSYRYTLTFQRVVEVESDEPMDTTALLAYAHVALHAESALWNVKIHDKWWAL